MMGGATDEVTEQELDGGGGALTQMLCAPQTCPLLQSLSVIQPTLGGAELDAGGGGGGGTGRLECGAGAGAADEAGAGGGGGGGRLEGGGGAGAAEEAGAATQMLCAPQTWPVAQSALVSQPKRGALEGAGAGAGAGGAGIGTVELLPALARPAKSAIAMIV